jgi:hypothetical protein
VLVYKALRSHTHTAWQLLLLLSSAAAVALLLLLSTAAVATLACALHHCTETIFRLRYRRKLMLAGLIERRKDKQDVILLLFWQLPHSQQSDVPGRQNRN